MSENENAVLEVTLVSRLDRIADDVDLVARWWASIGHRGVPRPEDMDVMTLLLHYLRARAYEVATKARLTE